MSIIRYLNHPRAPTPAGRTVPLSLSARVTASPPRPGPGGGPRHARRLQLLV